MKTANGVSKVFLTVPIQPSILDRLLCGYVGFGKTEVALRAVMKCVSDAKQAAILAAALAVPVIPEAADYTEIFDKETYDAEKQAIIDAGYEIVE